MEGRTGKRKPRPPGRPRISENVTEIILRMARETGWGYARIQGELKKLGITVACNTIKKILIKNGFHPSPYRTKGDWDRFMKRHMDTLWACDFFTKDVWTAFGKATYYVLFFIHVGTRKVRVAGITCQPNGPWVEQHARNLAFDLGDHEGKSVYLLKDGDTKFTAAFDEVFRTEGIKVKRLPYASPNLNAHAERFVQAIKQIPSHFWKCLNIVLIGKETHPVVLHMGDYGAGKLVPILQILEHGYQLFILRVHLSFRGVGMTVDWLCFTKLSSVGSLRRRLS